MTRRFLLPFVLLGIALEQPLPAIQFPDDPSVYSVLILGSAGNVGSGLYLQHSNSLYLVTAKHVLYAEPVGTNPPALKSPGMLLTSRLRGNEENVQLTVDLKNLESQNAIRFSNDRDVCVVKLQRCNPTNRVVCSNLPGVTNIGTNRSILQMGSENIVRLKDVPLGADVFIIGFPLSLSIEMQDRIDPNDPLLRIGIVGGKNLKKRSLLIDGPVYQGNSGGPVFTTQTSNLGEIAARPIGIVSAFVPFREVWTNSTLRYQNVTISNSGYSLVEPIEIALDLMWE